MRDLVVWRRSESPSFDRAIVANVADQAVQRGVTNQSMVEVAVPSDCALNGRVLYGVPHGHDPHPQ